jgi:hypothetical protein
MKDKKNNYEMLLFLALATMIWGLIIVGCSSAKCVQDQVIKVEDANFERRGHKYYKVTYKSGCVIYTQKRTF